MRLRSFLIAVAALPLLGGAQPPGHSRPGYRLVWADEFDRPGLPDPGKWVAETEFNRTGWFNAEAQYYSAADQRNARIEKGMLVIEAHDGPPGPPAPADWGGQRYTSARLTTASPAHWTYGYFEIRAMFSCGRGSWPAIWMLPAGTARQWPQDGEIDIMEHVGFDPGVIHQSIHTGRFNHVANTQKTAAFPLAGTCGKMHRYHLEWTPSRILMGVDGRNHFTFLRQGNDRGAWPFDRPMRLILNLAVGGSWGGKKGIDPKAFPMHMSVDYVRVYQRAG